MLKRGQIAIFLILIVVISIAGALVFFAGKQKTGNEERTPVADASLVKKSITACVDDLTERYLLLFLAEGGALSFRMEEDSIDFPVRIYYNKGNISIPALDRLEDDFSAVMVNLLPYCVSENYPGFELSATTAKVRTDFSDKSSLITIDYPIEIRQISNKQHATISKFSVSVPIAVPKYSYYAQSIVQGIQEHPESIDIQALGRFDVNIGVEPKAPGFFVYTLEDAYGTQKKPVLFSFAAVFENSFSNERPFFVNLEDTYELQKGQRLEKDVNALDPDGDLVYYSVESDRTVASIDQLTGLLAFDSNGLAAGNYVLRVFADDGRGNWESIDVTVRVIA